MKTRSMNALLVLILLGMVFLSPTLSLAENSGSCPTCPPVEGIQQPEYISDAFGFKAMKAFSSTGKCLVTIFCPENKVVVDVVTGISLSHEWFGFLEKLVKDKTGWFDPTVSGIKVGSNIAKEMSQNYKDTFKNITGKVPGLTILLPCLTAGNEIYRLYVNYVDSVDFGLESFSITPIQVTLPKNDFFYPAIAWPDKALAAKYQGLEEWRVDLRLRQIGGDPAQVGTHWDRITSMSHWNNDVPLGPFRDASTGQAIIPEGQAFGVTPGRATSPSFYGIINASPGTQGVREGTNIYSFAINYEVPGLIFDSETEYEQKNYFSVWPDANMGGDPEDPVPIVNQTDDWTDREPPAQYTPPFRTPGNDHADENLSVANQDVPDARPNDLRQAYTRLATKKGLNLVIARELLKEARHAEKYYYDLLSQDLENPELLWKWSGAVHRVKTHAEELKGLESRMLAEYRKAPDVAILDRGYAVRAEKLLRKLHIPSVYVGTDFSPDIVKDHPVLFIPSAGLYGLDGSAMFKARLEEYARKGGTIVCLTQQHGTDFQALPGGQLTGFGWLEDQSCHTRSLSIASLHPVLAGQYEAILTAGVDGFFTQVPPNTQVLLRRTKNNMPGAVLYPFGDGRVIALCLYSDWISGLGGETRDDRALIADIIHWAEDPLQAIPENRTGYAVNVPVTLKNRTEEPATHVLFYTLRPNGTIFKHELKEIALAAQGSQTVDYSIPGIPDQPGLWTVDYVLFDFDGPNRVVDFEEPEVQFQAPGARFAVRNNIPIVTALNAYNLYITSPQEVFFKGEIGPFTFTVENNTGSEQTLTLMFYFHHHAYDYTHDSQTYGSLSAQIMRQLIIPAGGKVNVPYSVPILGSDRVFATLYDRTGQYIRVADRQINVQKSNEILGIAPLQASYEVGETVGLNLSIAGQGGNLLNGEALLKVRNPSNLVVYSSGPIPLENVTTYSNSFAYTLPTDAPSGTYLVTLELLNPDGIRIGGNSGSFQVPEKPVYGAINLPSRIDPRVPSRFSLTLTNLAGRDLDGCSLDFFVDKPGGGTIFHRNSDLATLAQGPTVFQYDVDFSTVFYQGQYVARYTLSSTTPALTRQGRKTFARTFTYSLQLDQRTYQAGEDATLTLTVNNTGLFDEPLDVTMTADGAPLIPAETIVAAASSVTKESFPFAVPQLGTGVYPIECALQHLPDMAKSVALMIKPQEMVVSFPSGSHAPGDILEIGLTNPNGLPLPVDYSFVLMDELGNALYEQLGEALVPGGGSSDLAALLPAELTGGDYYVELKLFDSLNGVLLKRQVQSLPLAGDLAATITSAPNQETYSTGNTGAVTTHVSVTPGIALTNATLDVSVVSTVDTGEWKWARSNQTFTEQMTPFRVVRAKNVYANTVWVDLDNDGDKDLVVIVANALSFYENASLGGRAKFVLRNDWKTGFSVPSGRSAYAVTLGDLDADGLQDLLVLDDYQYVHTYKNTGTQSLPSWQENNALRTNLPATLSAISLILIDLDGDGDLDLVGANINGGKMGYRNSGNPSIPSFTADTTGLLGGVSSSGNCLIFLDLNGDGKKDLISAYYYSGTGYENADFYLNTTADPVNGASSITWSRQAGDTLTWASQTGGNKWGFKKFWQFTYDYSALQYPRIQGLFDVDQDGKEDLLVVDIYGCLQVYKDNPSSPANGSGQPHYYEYAGLFEHVTPFKHMGEFYPPPLSLADLNGDGKEEVVTPIGSNNSTDPAYFEKAGVYENVRTEESPLWKRSESLEQALNSKIAYSSPGYDYLSLVTLTMADLDGDGLKDVITYGATPASQTSSGFHAYKNQGGNPPTFTAATWLDPVWAALPKHYEEQWSGPARQNDYGFNQVFRDFDSDGDLDLFISYAWERFYYFNSYEHTRGGFVAFENTGTATDPVFTRKSAWEAGLSELVIGTQRGDYPMYMVNVADVDGDGTMEAYVCRKSTQGIFGYRWNGSSWTLDSKLTTGITLSQPLLRNNPNILDIDGDGENELVVTTATTGGLEIFRIARDAAFEVVETTSHTFTGSLSHETSLGVIPVPGRMQLFSKLTSQYGQTLAEFQDEFYVVDSGQSVLLKIKTDKAMYKAGETARITGIMKNLGALSVTNPLTITRKDTGGALLSQANLTLSPGQTYPFEVSVPDVQSSFFVTAAFGTFQTLAQVQVSKVSLNVSVDMPTAVNGLGTFDAVITMANPTELPGSIELEVEGSAQNLTINPLQALRVVKNLRVTSSKEIVFSISGDYSQTIRKTVTYEPGASVVFSAQAVYPAGILVIPYVVTNTGSLDDSFDLYFEGAVTAVVRIDAPAGSEVEYLLELDSAKAGYGSKSVYWYSSRGSGVIRFVIAKENDVSVKSFTATGLEGNETDGFFVGFDVALQNQGYNDFEGSLVAEIEGVSRKQADLQLAAGEERTLHLLLTAPIENGTYACRLSAMVEAETLATRLLTFTLASGLEVTSLPAGLIGSPGSSLSFEFVVKNNGVRPEQMEAGLTSPFGFDESNVRNAYLEAGAETALRFTELIPDDATNGAYTATLGLNGKIYEVPFQVSGVLVDATASLNKAFYTANTGDTCTMTLSVSNRNADFAGASLYALATYNGTQQRVDFTLQSSNQLQFAFEVTAQNGRINWGIYQSSGRSVVLNDVLVRTGNSQLTLVPDKNIYRAGETVRLPVVAPAAGTLTLRVPDLGWESVYAVSSGQSVNAAIPLGAELSSGTYVMVGTLETESGTLTETLFFDVIGRSVRPVEFALSKKAYFPNDVMEAKITLESNFAFQGLVVAAISSEAGAKDEIFSELVSLGEGKTVVSITGDFQTDVSGIHYLTVKLVNPSDGALVYTSCSKAFDVGGIALVGIATDAAQYTSTVSGVLLTVRAFGSDPADAQIFVNGTYFSTVRLEPQSLVEKQVDIPSNVIPPGPVTIEAKMSSGGLISSKKVSFVFGMDLPDLVPSGLGLTLDGSKSVLSGLVENRGKSLAQSIQASFYKGTQESGVLLGTVSLDSVSAGGSAAVSLEVAQDLQGSVITLAVNLSAGQEFNAANNVTSKTFDTLNHVPMITFVSPAADEAFGAQYEIRWTASDEDGDPLSVDIYVDSDTEPVNGRSLVAAGQPNTGSYLLNTSLLTDGTYYISITVSDGKRGSATGYSLGRIGNEDMDGDGARDSEDNCIETPNPDQRDSDGDGVGDACDPFPNDKNEWLDSDGDGVGDKGDGCPNDPNKLSPQRCGCGKAETDSDGDGVPDCVDPFPNDKNEWMDSDGDGIGDNADLDDDNDGMPDAWEILHGLNPRNAADAAGDRDGDGLSNLEEYEQGRDPNNKPPQKPVLLSPADGEQDVALTPKLETDAFQDQDPGDSHALTEWEISAVEGDFSESALVFRLESGTYLTSFVVPEAILDLNRTYFWRVRFQDSKGEPSEWSEAASFVTVTVDENDQDGNGTPDEQEVDDRKLDLDADGIPDITEPDMACVKTALGNQKIALSGVTNVVSIDYVKSVDPADIPGTGKKPHQFPWGVISFRVAVDHPGDTAKVIVYLPHPASPNARWYKYDVINGWQDYSDHVTFGDKRKSVILELTDGGDGDADGVANGVIVDPSGVGEPAASVASSQGGGGGGCFVGALEDTSPAAGYGLGLLALALLGVLRAVIPRAQRG